MELDSWKKRADTEREDHRSQRLTLSYTLQRVCRDGAGNGSGREGENEFSTQFPEDMEESKKGKGMDASLGRTPEYENLEMDLPTLCEVFVCLF